MAKYKAYPEHKDSGVEWLGAIPPDWEVVNLKFVANLSTEKSAFMDCRYVGMENISSNDGKYIAKEDISPEGTSLSFKVDDVLFGKLRPYLAKSWLATFAGICSSEFLVLRTERLHPRFLNYFSLTKEFIEQVNSSTYGTKMPRASWEFIGSLPVPTCSFKLSKIIADFLDHETAKIDNLIEKQQQLIELLKEKRQAVISHAVTKGLNPDVPMKDSGVEWLGEVPEHWDVSQIKYLSSFVGTGGTPKNPESFTDNDGINWFSPGDFNGSLVLQDAKKKISKSSVHNGDSKIYPENSIVVIGIGATLGKVALAASLFSCNQQINIIVPNEKIEPNYLAHSLSNQMEQMKQSSNASTIGIMNQEKTKKIWIALPKIDEQLEIIEFLLKKTTEFDLLLNWSDKQIQLLQERRTAPISAAVTGKIDVRHWVAPDTSDIEVLEEATA